MVVLARSARSRRRGRSRRRAARSRRRSRRARSRPSRSCRRRRRRRATRLHPRPEARRRSRRPSPPRSDEPRVRPPTAWPRRPRRARPPSGRSGRRRSPRARSRLPPTRRMKWPSICSVVSKSAITPWRRGRVATIVAGVRPSICRAFSPTAYTWPVCWSIATTDGSNRTIPSPRRKTTVFAVPRSTARSVPAAKDGNLTVAGR